MNLKQIQELIKFVAKSGATEVDLEMGDVKICIKSPPKGKINIDSSSSIVPVAPVTPEWRQGLPVSTLWVRIRLVGLCLVEDPSL